MKFIVISALLCEIFIAFWEVVETFAFVTVTDVHLLANTNSVLLGLSNYTRYRKFLVRMKKRHELHNLHNKILLYCKATNHAPLDEIMSTLPIAKQMKNGPDVNVLRQFVVLPHQNLRNRNPQCMGLDWADNGDLDGYDVILYLSCFLKKRRQWRQCEWHTAWFVLNMILALSKLTLTSALMDKVFSKTAFVAVICRDRVGKGETMILSSGIVVRMFMKKT